VCKTYVDLPGPETGRAGPDRHGDDHRRRRGDEPVLQGDGAL